MQWRRQCEDDWRASAQFARIDYRHLYADRWQQVCEESNWLKPRDNWDPKLVWVLRSFLEQREKWDTPQRNPKRNAWFKYWSPRFYVVQNDVLIETDTGVDGWQGTITPLLKKLMGV